MALYSAVLTGSCARLVITADPLLHSHPFNTSPYSGVIVFRSDTDLTSSLSFRALYENSEVDPGLPVIRTAEEYKKCQTATLESDEETAISSGA